MPFLPAGSTTPPDAVVAVTPNIDGTTTWLADSPYSATWPLSTAVVRSASAGTDFVSTSRTSRAAAEAGVPAAMARVATTTARVLPPLVSLPRRYTTANAAPSTASTTP